MTPGKMQIGIAGAGFSGAVMARELAETGKYRIVVFDERDHVGGNCYTRRDPASGVMVHEYGPHIFHTDREDVWRYLNRFTQFGNYTNRVKAVTAEGVYSLPINLLTINQLFRRRFNPQEARKFIAGLGDTTIQEPRNFEEQALKMMGRRLYENFFYGYTKKQWGVDPRELPASILKRLPMRFSYDDNYYSSRFQGIPVEGYTPIFERLLDHPNIELRLSTRFTRDMSGDFARVLFSGPMDAYFSYRLGRLRYRTLVFERFQSTGDHQGNPVINYCEESVPHTRITEHKHFAPWESHDQTVCFTEYSKLTLEGDVPYYPLRLAEDKAMLADYVELARREPKVTFIGRLGTYRYLDMHMVVGESLDLARRCVALSPEQWPTFSTPPIEERPGLGQRAA